MLRPYLWDWDWIFGRAVKTISSLGVRSPWSLVLFSQIPKFCCFILKQQEIYSEVQKSDMNAWVETPKLKRNTHFYQFQVGFISSLPNPQRLSTNWWWFLHYLFWTGGIGGARGIRGGGGIVPPPYFCSYHRIKYMFVLKSAFITYLHNGPSKGNIFWPPAGPVIAFILNNSSTFHSYIVFFML